MLRCRRSRRLRFFPTLVPMESTYLGFRVAVGDAEDGAGGLRNGRRPGWRQVGAVRVGET